MAEVEPQSIGSDLLSIAETMRSQFAAGHFSSCPVLVSPANYCSAGKHGIAEDRGPGLFLHVEETGVCAIRQAEELVKRRREIVGRCALVSKVAARYEVAWSMQSPLWSQLLKAIDPSRPVSWSTDGRASKPLAALLEMVERGCRQPNKQAPHLLLQGPCGTGKTTLQAVLYLAACEAGHSAAFVDSIALRTLATNLNSRFTPTAEGADREMERLIVRDVIFWSDVGDTQATHKEFSETVTSLLERFNGRLVMSSNLDPSQLMKHPDIGERAVSRMLAGRHGKASIVIQVTGADQRKVGAPLQTVMEL